MTGPAWVTGTITVAPAEDCTGPTSNTTVDGVGHELGHRCEAEPFAASDPRLSGTGVEQRNQDAHQAPGNPTMVIGAGT